MQTISLPVLEAGEYAGGIWYYEPHTYQSYRYVLGRVGKHPLVCIGINPSTAQPGALDPTLKSVERIARFDGSWLVPVNYGTTTLTADCGGFTAQCTVTVVRPEE